MSSANIGWLFYKDYFNDLDYTDISSDKNRKIIEKKVQNIINCRPKVDEGEMLGNAHFKATTTYPGLLLGSGNAHTLPKIDAQATLGFHFDYTTGLPVIPGSSVKGVLRSAFKHPEYIRSICACEDVKALEEEIFDNGDVFFDAQIISVGTQLLGDDYLTPHGDDPLKSPTPLRFIKVMPGVSFRFDFALQESELLSRSRKLELFRTILADLGVGAKTNVGYGKLENFSMVQTEAEREAQRLEREKEAFADALKEESIEALQLFKANFSHSKLIVKADEAIETLKTKQEKEAIERAFNNLEGRKKYIDSFMEKYKDNPLAAEYVSQLETNGNSDDDLTAVLLASDNIATVKNTLQTMKDQNMLPLSDALTASFIDKLKVLYDASSKRNKKKFFSTIQLGRFLGKEAENDIKGQIEP